MVESVSCAIILAGGKSERMGEDKALLSLDGMTFLEHVVTTMLELTNEIIVVVDREDRYTLPYGRMVVDVFPEVGPVGAIITGLMASGQGTHYVVPCDMPALNPNVLHLLSQAASPPLDAVVAEIDGTAQPLCAVYRHTAMPKLLAYLESGKRSARGALTTLHVMRIGEGVLRRIDPDLASFSNINTPEELALLRQKKWKQP